MALADRLRSRDLAVVGVCILLADVAILADLPVLRLLFGALVVLVLPGYALVSALLSSVDSVEGVTYVVGSSVVVVGLVGLAIHVTPFAITTATVLAVTNVVTFVSLAVARRRRKRAPDADDTAPSGDESSLGGELRGLFAFDTRTDTVLSVLLLGTLLLATGSVTYAVTGPDQGESYTELYLLTKNDSGEFVTSGYPSEFVQGEPQSLYVGVGNHEGEPTAYTLVVEVQRVRKADGSVEVLEDRQLDRRRVEVGPGESKRFRHSIAPEMQGQGLRVAYLLYEGSPPEDPTVENAYQSVHLRVNVSATNETG